MTLKRLGSLLFLKRLWTNEPPSEPYVPYIFGNCAARGSNWTAGGFLQPDETRVEVGLIGREGMSGIPVVLGGDQSPPSTSRSPGERGQVLMLLISLLIIRDTIKVPRDFNSRPAPRKATVAPSEGV